MVEEKRDEAGNVVKTADDKTIVRVVCNACKAEAEIQVSVAVPDAIRAEMQKIFWKYRRYGPDWCAKCVETVQKKLDEQGAKGVDGVSPQRIMDELLPRG